MILVLSESSFPFFLNSDLGIDQKFDRNASFNLPVNKEGDCGLVGGSVMEDSPPYFDGVSPPLLIPMAFIAKRRVVFDCVKNYLNKTD